MQSMLSGAPHRPGAARHQHRRCLRSTCPPSLLACRASAQRQRKDPRAFKDMDAAREYLHQQDGGGGGLGLARALNWLSQHSFGSMRAARKQGGQPPPWDLGRFYRWLTRPGGLARPPISQQPSEAELLAACAAAGASRQAIDQLATLMLCSTQAAAKVVLKHPQVLAIDSQQLLHRLVLLKRLLPTCDVARLCEQAPSLYLDGEPAVFEQQLSAALCVLRQRLPGLDVDEMVQEDPGIPWYPGLGSGIDKLFELWPQADAETFRGSDPAEVGLAIKALSDAGPPRRY